MFESVNLGCVRTYVLAHGMVVYLVEGNQIPSLLSPPDEQERIQVYPPPEAQQEQLVTLLQVRLMKKLGRNAYPFTFSVSKGEVLAAVWLEISEGVILVS